MKRIIMCTALLLCLSGLPHAWAGWSEITIGTTANLTHVSYPTATDAWACDDTGGIWHSNDGGWTWTQQADFPGNTLTGIEFANDQFGTACSREGRIFATTDGGTTWTQVLDGVDLLYEDVHTVPGTLTSYVGGQASNDMATLRFTTDGWATHSAVTFDVLHGIDEHLGKVWVVENPAPGTLVVNTECTEDGTFGSQTSDDGGLSWQVNIVGSPRFSDLDFYDDVYGLLVQDDGDVFWTIFGHYIYGFQWATAGTPYAPDGPGLNGVSWGNADNAWVVGDYGTIAHSDGGGAYNTWEYEASHTLHNLNDVDMVDELTGIIVGNRGRVFVYDSATDPATLTLTPYSSWDTIPAEGGTLQFDATFVSSLGSTIPGLRFWTTITSSSDEVYGPLFSQNFTHTPFMNVTVTNLTQDVPGSAPAGLYILKGHVGYYPNPAVTGSFIFEKLAASSTDGVSSQDDSDFVDDWTAGGTFLAGEPVEPAGVHPDEYALSAAYPNPFNPSTALMVTLPEAGELTVQVFDIQGRLVTTLARGQRAAGQHLLTFDAATLASGIYFVHAEVPGRLNDIRKVTLLQ
ncbi:T9SS type A sorting domain-containing protein [bacterium]|nr:T9SS type A sorting domain-containing protein [bacterium]